MMHLIEIDAVGLQTPQARLASSFDVQSRQPRLIRPIAHPTEHLRCQYNFFTPSPTLSEPTPHNLLGPAFADFPTIDVRRVEKVEAQLQRSIHDGKTVCLVGLRPKVHRAETEPADFHASPTEMNIFHQ